MKDKKYYEGVYEALIEEARVFHIKEYGDDEDFIPSEAVSNFLRDWVDVDYSAEEIVGYYICYYGDNALEEWLNNTKGNELNDAEVEATRILKELYN